MSDFRVLAPLDGSLYAEHSLAYLPSLTPLGDLALALLGVVDDSHELAKIAPTEYDEREFNVLSAYLGEVADDLGEYLNVKATTEVLRGQPAQVIVERARRLEADAILISTHGRSGVTRWRRGSVADKVIRTSPRPVLVVGPRAMERDEWRRGSAGFRRILTPLDGSEMAERAVPEALRYVTATGAQLHLQRVMQMPLMTDGFAGAPAYTAQVVEGLVQSGEEYMAEVAKRFGLPQGTVASVRIGTPTIVIEDYITANEIDLVVMTSHGRGGFVRAALGSVADRLIGAGPPVLVVPGAPEVE